MKPFREPDRHKPRFRKNIIKVLNQEFYKKLFKEHPDLVLSRQDIKLIMNTFHELCKNVIADTRDGLELMEQLGYIILGAYKKKESMIDQKKSMEYQQQVVHRNWNSDSWLCKINYSNFASKYRFKNSTLWAFEANRILSKKVSNAFIKDHKKYTILDDYFKINYLFRVHNKILKEKLKQQKDES